MNPQLKENRIIQEKAYLNIKIAFFMQRIKLANLKREKPYKNMALNFNAHARR